MTREEMWSVTLYMFRYFFAVLFPFAHSLSVFCCDAAQAQSYFASIIIFSHRRMSGGKKSSLSIRDGTQTQLPSCPTTMRLQVHVRVTWKFRCIPTTLLLLFSSCAHSDPISCWCFAYIAWCISHLSHNAYVGGAETEKLIFNRNVIVFHFLLCTVILNELSI
jgi:hypothetical protein